MNRYFPCLDWARGYSRRTFASDGLAAVIVIVMLIPQSLAYALLAGLPPEAGIYASIVPIMLYAVFGTSRTLAVGPVAVVSLLTASAIGQVADAGTAGYAIAALTLALLSGGFLVLLGIFRLGFFVNFLSHPVISGFIAASAILIAMSQMKHLLGIDATGHSLLEMLNSLVRVVGDMNLITFAIGGAAIMFLVWTRIGLGALLGRIGVPIAVAKAAVKAAPMAAVVATTALVAFLHLDNAEVEIVGHVPQGLPPFTLPDLSLNLVGELLMPAVLISIIGFVESVSVGKTLAAKKQQRINPDQELIGLGAANLGAAFTGGFPVTGGFARSVVNHDAGAETPAAGAFTAIGLAIASVALTPLVYYLPKATLAATIIVAVLSLIDLSVLKKSWRYSMADFAAVALTIFATLGFGVEIGVATGVAVSLALHLYKTSRPHVAEVGLVPGTQHFRNIRRHQVDTVPEILSLRVDESLYFVNASFLEDYITNRLADYHDIRHVVLMFSAVNVVDFSALESLEVINRQLKIKEITLHLSEVKGPVMDRLKTTSFLSELTGEVFLSQYDAWIMLHHGAGKD